MKRVDLAWALGAVLPHAGTEKQGLNQVGLEFRAGQLYVYATDRYTVGIARVNEGADIRGALPAKEATDLMRFVRTDYVPEREDDIAYALAPNELHIGFARQVNKDGTREEDSAVFELTEPKVPFDFLLDWLMRLNDAEPEWDELILQPKLAEKFAKASRNDTDRLRITPRHATDVFGAAVVTVGSDFLGAIAGMTYDQLGAATVADFLNTERQAA